MKGRIKHKLEAYRGKRKRKNAEKAKRDMKTRVH
jgi:hypothetical protein